MDQIAEIKSKLDIVDVVGEHVTLKKAGRNFRGLCPFHDEKTPSFSVNSELQIFKCFGCGEGGDIISFLQKHEGMEFPEALQVLADRAGVKLQKQKGFQKSQKDKLFQINDTAQKFYHYVLTKHVAGKNALTYITKNRGISLLSVNKFKLGFSPNTPNALSSFLAKRNHKIEDLVEAGLVYKKGSYAVDRFRGRVIFPLFDHRGSAVGFAGRLLPADMDKNLAKYINTPETPIYHKSNLLFGLNETKKDIKTAGNAIVVEGELDAISTWQAGIKNVVALKGSALTVEQARLLGRFTKNLILALDSDSAGEEAARRGATIAQAQGLNIKVARLTKFKDPDEAARKDPVGYKKALENAVEVWDFVIDVIFSRYDAMSGGGKLNISREIVPVLASIPDKIVQSHYVSLVASRLRVSVEAVAKQIGGLEEKGELREQLVNLEKQEKTREQLLEERLLTIAFSTNPSILGKEGMTDLVDTHLARRILDEYLSYAKTKKKFVHADFLGKLPSELKEGYSDLILVVEDEFLDKDKTKRELGEVVRNLRVLKSKKRLKYLAQLISKYEKEDDEEKLKKAQKMFGKVADKLSTLEEEE